MTQAQILKLMIQANPEQSADWTMLPALYAIALAEIADRLSSDQLYRQIAFGALIYQRCDQELLAGCVTTRLLAELGKR